ncbi:MAG: hypothetical protein HYU86_07040 [Chloroflexi bacterium]|nr:hypothetical protein [Chloroflexota bacterium]
MNDQVILERLEQGGALSYGHFVRRKNLHTDIQVHKYMGLHHPRATDDLCAELLQRFEGESFHVVVVRAIVEDIILGYTCGRILGTSTVCVANHEGLVSLIPPTGLTPGARALVVADVLSNKGYLQEIMAAIESRQGVVGGIALLIDEGIEALSSTVRVESLLSLKEHNYPLNSCPMCFQGMPLSGGS